MVLGPLAAAALVLAACGSDDSSGTTTTPTTIAPATEQASSGATGAAEPATPNDEDKVAAADSRMAFQPVEYVYEGDMPPIDGPAQAWRWSPDRTPTTEEITGVAVALGVEGDVTEQPADMGGGWVVGGEGAQRLAIVPDAQGNWSFIGDTSPLCTGEAAVTGAGSTGAAAPAAEPPPAVAPDDPAATSEVAPADAEGPVAPPDTAACVEPVGIPTADEARARAIELLEALGLDPNGYEITADSQEWGAWVDARLLIDGLAAPVITSFGFGAEAALTYASGQLFAPEPAGPYERTGTAAALEQLQADQMRSYNPVTDPAATEVAPLPATDVPVPGESAGDAPAGSPADGEGGSSASPVEPDTPVSSPDSPIVDASNPSDSTAPIDSTPPEPITVVLTGVEAGWWMIWADDGTIWMLPGYDFLTDQGERISAPAVAQIDMPVVETMTGTAEPAIGAGEPPSEADLAPPLGD